MATLAGKITDVTGRTPESISSITVKAPAARIGSSTDVIVSSPATVDFNRATGDITITNLTGGLSWLYIEGDGWADSIALAVADGMTTIVEAVANASGIPGVADYIALLTELETRIDAVAQGAVDAAAAGIKYVQPALTDSSNVDALTSGLHPVPNSTVATALGLPLAEPGELETTWLDSSGLRRRQTLRVDPVTGDRPGYAMYRRWYYNGTWQPWVRYDDAWHKGRLSISDNISNLAQGAYEVPSVAVAKALGLPAEELGTLTIYHLGNGIYRRAVFDVDPASGYSQFRARYYNGTWYEWKLEVTSFTPFFRGPIPDGVQPDTMTGTAWNGEWTLLSGNGSAWGLPSNAASVLYISSSGTSTLQEITTFTTPIQKYQRRAYNGAWSGPWENMLSGGGTDPEPAEANEYATVTSKLTVNALVPSAVDPTLTYVADHAALVTDLKSRLGTVSTGGKAAVALVADHGTTAFKDWMWAEAKARNIPFTMALSPEIHLDGKGDSRHTASNADIKQWISEGLVIASHSGDHEGALGYYDVSRQIQTSKAKLEEKLETTVDCWVQPGYALATGNFDGFGTGQSEERYTDYYAGRMLQQNYAVVTGYVGNDYVYPGDQDLPVGVRRSLVERKDAYQGVLDYIEQAITTGGKHINFCHPYAIPESSTTYVTKSEYIAYLDWLVAKRDAGDLVLLTLPQLMVSRP